MKLVHNWHRVAYGSLLLLSYCSNLALAANAEVLDPYEFNGRHSPLTLAFITENSPTESAALLSNKIDTAGQNLPKTPDDADTMETQADKQYIKTISVRINKLEQQNQTELEFKLNRMYVDSDAKVRQLENEMENLFASNGTILRSTSTGGVYYDPEPANERIRETYYPKIEQVKERARYDANNVIEWYKAKQIALEDSALNLEKSYMSRRHMGTVTLKPADGDIYVRNYQTTDTASGSSVPIMAAQRKLVSKVKSSNKLVN